MKIVFKRKPQKDFTAKQRGKWRRENAVLIAILLALIIASLIHIRIAGRRNIFSIILFGMPDSVQSEQQPEPVEGTALPQDGNAPQSTKITGDVYEGEFVVVTEEQLPTEPIELPVDQIELDCLPILQKPELPTGCEVTALTMALNYVGYDVDKLTIADDYLVRADPFLTTFGEAFVGSPYDDTAWGCYAPVIVKTANRYIAAQDGSETVTNLTGSSMKTLLSEVANGNPVITWVTMNMTDKVREVYYWTTPDGKDAVFLEKEHCVLLCGYDLNKNTVTVCDPLKGRVNYDLDLFESRYHMIYDQAVLIRSN